MKKTKSLYTMSKKEYRVEVRDGANEVEEMFANLPYDIPREWITSWINCHIASNRKYIGAVMRELDRRNNIKYSD